MRGIPSDESSYNVSLFGKWVCLCACVRSCKNVSRVEFVAMKPLTV